MRLPIYERPYTSPQLLATRYLSESLSGENGRTPAINDKGRPEPPFFKPCNRFVGSGRRRLLGRPLLHRPGVLAARIDIAVDELDHADRRAIAVAVARLEHAGIAAVARGVARPQHLEQLLHHRRVAQLGKRLTARVQVAALCERHQLLDDRT